MKDPIKIIKVWNIIDKSYKMSYDPICEKDNNKKNIWSFFISISRTNKRSM